MSRILIADNELSLVAELEQHLSAEGHQVVGSTITGYQALAMVEKMQPDLVLMEIKLSGEMDGITTAIRIREAFHTPVIFMTWYGDKRTLGEARWAHPAGYVMKPFQWDQVNSAIADALNRDADQNDHAPTSPTGWYVNLIGNLKSIHERESNPLTPTEARIANLIIQGTRTKDIALLLNMQQSTVHWHQKNIRQKMGITGKKENLMSNLVLRSQL